MSFPPFYALFEIRPCSSDCSQPFALVGIYKCFYDIRIENREGVLLMMSRSDWLSQYKTLEIYLESFWRHKKHYIVETMPSDGGVEHPYVYGMFHRSSCANQCFQLSSKLIYTSVEAINETKTTSEKLLIMSRAEFVKEQEKEQEKEHEENQKEENGKEENEKGEGDKDTICVAITLVERLDVMIET